MRTQFRTLVLMTIAAALSVGVLVAAGCGSDDDDGGGGGGGGGGDGSPVKIALAAPYTGEASYYGEWVDDAFKLAMDEHGDTIDGHKIELIKADTKCTPTDAVAAGRNALAQKPVAMLTVCSGDTGAILPLAGRQKVPVMTVGVVPALTEDGNKFLWRVQTHDGVTGEAFGKYIAEQGAKRVGVIHDTSAYGVANAEAIVKALKDNGVEVPVNASYDFSSTDYSGQLLAVKKADVDAVYIEGYDIQAGNLVKQAVQLGLNVPLYLPTTASSTTFRKTAGAAHEKVTFATPFLPDWSPEAKKYSDDWESRFGYSANSDTAGFYEIAVGVIEALKATGGDPSSTEFNEAFGDLSVAGMPMGTVSFTETGDIADPRVLVGKWKNNKPVLVENLTP